MKKYSLFLLLFSIFLFGFELYGKTETVGEFSFKPDNYFRFWENNLKNYWRCSNRDMEKKIDPDLAIITDEFKLYIGILDELLKLSGLYDIEEVSGQSVKCTNDDGSICFKNDISIEYDEDTKGFLKTLFSELPKEKVPALSEAESELKDLYLIKNNTLLTYEMPLNFNAMMQTEFKNSRFCKKLDAFSRKYLLMPVEELADQLTGVWGGIVNINKFDEGKNSGKYMLDFLFVIPDPQKKIFKNLGEYLVINRKAVAKDKLLIWRTSSLLRNVVMISSDNFLMIASSPEDIVKLGETAEKKEMSEVVKKLKIPFDADEKPFIFWNREFNAFVNMLFFGKSFAFKFMEDFSGSDVFCTFEFDDDEVEIKQYASAPLSQMLLMPFSFHSIVHYDSWVFDRGKKKYIAFKIASHSRKCMNDMQDYALKLKAFKQKFGKYPEGINAAGLKKFAAFAKIPADKFTISLEKGKTAPFTRYYYWGENHSSNRSDIPLLCDKGKIHHNKIHVIFCDGSVREFELENVRSAKRIVSFLHTVFRYDNAIFAMLLKQAEKLDSEKL